MTMRKKILFITSMIFMGALITSSLLTAEEVQTIITIMRPEGTVLVKIQPSTEWLVAKIGQVLQKGDGIKTLADGKAHLKLNGNVGFLLGPNSEFIVESPFASEPFSEVGSAKILAPSYAPKSKNDIESPLVAEPSDETSNTEIAVPIYAPNVRSEVQASRT